jgi:hypothetical protein
MLRSRWHACFVLMGLIGNERSCHHRTGWRNARRTHRRWCNSRRDRRWCRHAWLPRSGYEWCRRRFRTLGRVDHRIGHNGSSRFRCLRRRNGQKRTRSRCTYRGGVHCPDHSPNRGSSHGCIGQPSTELRPSVYCRSMVGPLDLLGRPAGGCGIVRSRVQVPFPEQ